MNIVVTGSEGFIGRALVARFKQDPLNSVEAWDIKRGYDIFFDGFHQIVKWADVVYHLAAITSVQQSFADPGSVLDVNVLGTSRVVYLCKRYKKKLVYPSSASVQHPELSPYARSKYLSEEIVKSFKGSFPLTVLRLFNVYGDDMNPDSASVMYNYLHDKKLRVYGNGEQTRDYISIRDVVNIMVDAVKKKWDGKVVDVGTGVPTSVNYVAELFAYYRKLKIKYLPARIESKWSVADTSMLCTLYTKKLLTNLEQDIKNLCLRQ